MKKLLITTLSFFIIALSGNAQSADTLQGRFSVAVNAGLSIPQSDYGSSPNASMFTPTGRIYGYSKQGYHLDLCGTYIPSGIIGITVKLGADQNQMNFVSQALAGVYLLALKNNPKFGLFFTGLAGISIAKIAYNTNITDLAPAGPATISETPGTGNGFMLYAGMGCIYKACKKIHLTLSAGYLVGNIHFSNSTQTLNEYTFSSYPNGTPTVTTSKEAMTMSVGVIEVTLGASYHFGK